MDRPGALVLAFLLTFFPWAGYAGAGGESHLPWGWGWGGSDKWNPLTFFYTLTLLFALFASGAITVLRLIPGFKLPPALQQVWSFRAGAVALLTFLGLFFLLIQLFVGFQPETDTLHTTIFVWLALLFQILALAGSVLDLWLEVRGPSKPMPRIDMHW